MKMVFLSIFLMISAYAMQWAMEKEEASEITEISCPQLTDLQNLCEQLKKLSEHSTYNDLAPDASPKGSDLSSQIARRKSLSETKTEIWGATILAGSHFYQSAFTIIENQKIDSFIDQEYKKAESLLIKATNLFMQAYDHHFQKEALSHLSITLPYIIAIEQKIFLKKNKKKEQYDLPEKIASLTKSIQEIAQKEDQRRNEKKEQRRASMGYLADHPSELKNLNSAVEKQDLLGKIRIGYNNAERLLDWARVLSEKPSLTNCHDSKTLCYKALATFFLIYDATKAESETNDDAYQLHEEAFTSIETAIDALTKNDTWISKNNPEQWAIDEKFRKAGEAFRGIKNDRDKKLLQQIQQGVKPLEKSSLPVPPAKTSPRADMAISWQEALRESLGKTSVTARVVSDEEPESALKKITNFLKKL